MSRIPPILFLAAFWLFTGVVITNLLLGVETPLRHGMMSLSFVLFCVSIPAVVYQDLAADGGIFGPLPEVFKSGLLNDEVIVCEDWSMPPSRGTLLLEPEGSPSADFFQEEVDMPLPVEVVLN